MSYLLFKQIGYLPDGHQSAAGWRNKELKAAVSDGEFKPARLAVVFELRPRWRRLLEEAGARFSKALQRS